MENTQQDQLHNKKETLLSPIIDKLKEIRRNGDSYIQFGFTGVFDSSACDANCASPTFITQFHDLHKNAMAFI